MPEQPLASVLTPVYNGADFLAECIESVLAQTYKNFEYIIVDNCSTDRTLEIASTYAQQDSRIRVHSNQTFVGVIENHNIAFNLISPDAKYCKVVSADDFIFGDCLMRMITFGEAHPSVGIIGSYQLSGRFIRWQGCTYPKDVLSGSEICRRLFFRDQAFLEGRAVIGFGTPTSLLYRADLVRTSGGFYPNSSPEADTSACYKYLHVADFGFIYQVLSYERTHAATQSAKSREINRYVSSCLNDLTQYGAFYLTKGELDGLISDTLKRYYRFLAVNYFVGFREKEFWNYHINRLKELGYPFSRLQLLRAAVITISQEVVNPGNAIAKLWRRVSSRFDRGAGQALQGRQASN